MPELPSSEILNALEVFHLDGAACLRGAFADWVDVIAAGIERNLCEPGPLASNLVQSGQNGGFFDDHCNWQRIPEFTRTELESPAARLAAHFMRSEIAQFFHEHVLVKEPGAAPRVTGDPGAGTAELAIDPITVREARPAVHSETVLQVL